MNTGIVQNTSVWNFCHEVYKHKSNKKYAEIGLPTQVTTGPGSDMDKWQCWMIINKNTGRASSILPIFY